MFDATLAFLVPGLGIAERDVYAPTARPIVRAINAEFELELTPGSTARCKVEVGGRSSRSFSLTPSLWAMSGGRRVAFAVVTFVTIDRTTSSAVPLSRRMWDAIVVTAADTDISDREQETL
jgi:acyl-CoA thioesterase FadM